MLINGDKGAGNTFFMVLPRIAFEIFIERVDAAVEVRALVILVDAEDRCFFCISHPMMGVRIFGMPYAAREPGLADDRGQIEGCRGHD